MKPKTKKSAAPRLEIHAHPALLQVHDGAESTPAFLIQSPRGDGVAVQIFAESLADSLGAKLRKFDSKGKEVG